MKQRRLESIINADRKNKEETKDHSVIKRLLQQTGDILDPQKHYNE